MISTGIVFLNLSHKEGLLWLVLLGLVVGGSAFVNPIPIPRLSDLNRWQRLWIVVSGIYLFFALIGTYLIVKDQFFSTSEVYSLWPFEGTPLATDIPWYLPVWTMIVLCLFCITPPITVYAGASIGARLWCWLMGRDGQSGEWASRNSLLALRKAAGNNEINRSGFLSNFLLLLVLLAQVALFFWQQSGFRDIHKLAVNANGAIKELGESIEDLKSQVEEIAANAGLRESATNSTDMTTAPRVWTRQSGEIYVEILPPKRLQSGAWLVANSKGVRFWMYPDGSLEIDLSDLAGR